MTGYIDKQALIELLDNTENEERKYILNYLLTSYIFDEQWQTIEEFKANPVEGWCHICFGSTKNVDTAYYASAKFWWHDMHDEGENWGDVNITHVMPIKTPEAPK